MTEFAINNNISASSKLFSFYATKSLHFHMSFDILELSDTSIYRWIFKQKVFNIFENKQTT